MRKPLRNRRITTAVTARELRAIRWAASQNTTPPSLMLRDWSVREIVSEYELHVEALKARRLESATNLDEVRP